MVLASQRDLFFRTQFPEIQEDRLEKYGVAANLSLLGTHLAIARDGMYHAAFNPTVDSFLSDDFPNMWNTHLTFQKGALLAPDPTTKARNLAVERSATAAPSAAVLSLETVLALAARTAGGAVDADAPLLEAGLDSLGAVELRNQLQQALGEGAPALPSTLVFDHPTARQLAAYLEAQDASAAPAPPPSTPAGALL